MKTVTGFQGKCKNQNSQKKPREKRPRMRNYERKPKEQELSGDMNDPNKR